MKRRPLWISMSGQKRRAITERTKKWVYEGRVGIWEREREREREWVGRSWLIGWGVTPTILLNFCFLLSPLAAHPYIRTYTYFHSHHAQWRSRYVVAVLPFCCAPTGARCSQGEDHHLLSSVGGGRGEVSHTLSNDIDRIGSLWTAKGTPGVSRKDYKFVWLRCSTWSFV